MSTKTFHIGISMAGAISAGAYTAGVMDYLLEALENWEKAKELQEKGKLSNVPQHNIIIDILSGASAGGMTAALTAALIHTDFEHITKNDIDNESEKLTKNPLYHSWVNLVEDTDNDMMSHMLSTEDILDNNDNLDKEVRSIFNSNFIKEVAERHIKDVVKDPNTKRPYFAEDLEVLATLTNLRGIPFEVDFNNPSYTRIHRMKRHFDIAHFKIAADGSYNNDGKIPLHFEDKKGLNKDLLVQSAMATGGFPIGLEPRIIERTGKYILENKHLNLGKQPHLSTINHIDLYKTLNVDGGTINNDPFELTQKLLDDKKGIEYKDRKICAKDFTSTILMIDPFPNHSDIPNTKYTPLRAFKFIIGTILSAMLGELRMKEDVLKSAIGNEDYTKFLIIPSRENANDKKENHIACGSLGGFGGFFSKEFREHDFILGRRNCQKFIKYYFSVPLDAQNPIIDAGFKDIPNDIREEFFEKKVSGVKYLPLIPDIRVIYNKDSDTYLFTEAPEEKIGDFPKIKLSYLLSLNQSLKKRFAILIKNINNGKNLEEENENKIVKRLNKKAWYSKIFSTVIFKPFSKIILWIVGRKLKKVLAKEFINIIIKDMDDNELLVDK